MDKKDVDLIRVLQKEEIYLTADPFQKAAGLLGWAVDEVIERSRQLKDSGVIRRFGAALTPRNAGFKANAMVAWDCGARAVEAGSVMAGHPRVSHCYIRPRFEGFPYDVYTMIHASSTDDLQVIIAELSEAAEAPQYRVLTTLKELKKTSPIYFATAPR